MEPVRIIELDIREIAPKALWANALLVVIFAAAYHFFAEPLSFNFSWWAILFFTAGYVVLIVLHELFHLIGFVVFGKAPFSSLNYGLDLDMGIAYATTSHAIPNKAMKKALLLPFWVTAAIPAALGFWMDSQTLVLLAAMLAAGAYGDFHMYRALLREPDDSWILDDPKLPRLRVYADNPNEKSTGE
ncbi:MAG TPA: DUF3267 domain-containing protein [Planococcus sp. (in: firmicutes)]|nr:DUF3267 domain-containing protein [Planococcus sp. (in: firmicutes)]